jgi:hypothetical protein
MIKNSDLVKGAGVEHDMWFVTQVLFGVGLLLLCRAVDHRLQTGRLISSRCVEVEELRELQRAVTCHCQPVSSVMMGMQTVSLGE